MKYRSLEFCLDRDEMRGHDAARGVDGQVRLYDDAIAISYTMRMATVGGAQIDVGDDVPPERLSEALDRNVAAHEDEIRVMLTAIEEVEMSGGIIRSPRLIIRVRDERVIADLPWTDGCSCMMRMRRADAQRLREWVVEAELRLARIQTGSDLIS